MRYRAARADVAAKQSEVQRGIEAIHALTEREKWSQRQLAGKAGLSKTTWLRIQAGQMAVASALPRIRSALAILAPALISMPPITQNTP